jgi:signal transduction histidine kinase
MILFIGQEYVSYQSQNLLTQGLFSSQKVAEGVVQVKSLEKGVLDLQRNVLIYKENNSPSVLKRFNEIILSVNDKLKVTSLFITSNNIATNQEDALESMQNHLNDYRDNFDSVVMLLEKKNHLINEKIIPALSTLKKISADNFSENKKQPIDTVILENLNNLTSKLQLVTYKYFLSPTSENIDNFKTTVLRIQEISSKSHNKELHSMLKTLSNDFVLLTQITRNYNYLVNVVMSGSANEFLYLAKKLSEVVLNHLNTSNFTLNEVVSDSIFRGNIMFILGIFLTSIIAIYVLKRLILPIERVTEVFDTLASNKTLNDTLKVDRKDEIGHLIKSANIFRLKIKQTNDLLIQSQELNEKLAVSQRKAENATKSKSMFLANMSHEIRTPMNGIIGLVDLLLLNNLKEEEREYIDKIRYSSNILLNVINDILDFSKIEAGKIDIESAPFDPALVFENVIEAINVKAAEKNINVRCLIPFSLPKQVIGDSTRFSQILLNLGNNAVKFTLFGSVILNVTFKKSHNNDYILNVNIIDSGIGISEDQQKDIFNDFTQADGSTNRKFGGTGLGLSISKQLVELMGGEIKLSSDINSGSTFSVFIPFKQSLPPRKINNQTPYNQTLFIWNIGDYAVSVLENFNSYFSLVKTIQPNEAEIPKEKLTVNDLLLINLNGNLTLQQKDHITLLIKNRVKVGFCSDPYALNARSNINAFSAQPVILHPLLPSKITRFNSVITSLYLSKNEIFNEKSSPVKDLIKFSGHVLIVEDNAINQIVARKVIESFGLSCDLAEDGQQAVIKVTNSPDYDLIFMDVQMPVMDGCEATRKIREAGLDKLIICGLSANAMKSDVNNGKEAGMNEYITKPIVRDDVQQVLLKYLQVQ